MLAGCGSSWPRFPSRQRRGVSCTRPCSPTFATSSRPPTAGTSTRSSPVRGYADPPTHPHPPPGHIRPPGPDRCTRGRRRQSGQAQAGHGGDAARHAPDRARGVRAGLWLVRRRAPGGLARERPRRLLPRGGRASADAREAMQAVVNQRLDISCTNCPFWRMWVIK